MLGNVCQAWFDGPWRGAVSARQRPTFRAAGPLITSRPSRARTVVAAVLPGATGAGHNRNGCTGAGDLRLVCERVRCYHAASTN